MIVAGHRGACGYRPEHTLASYALAARMGADFIEPDVVCTRDGVLVARHEPEIGGTTDVAERFPSRRTVKTIDGTDVEGWFVDDFTLAELKTLRARERIPDVRPGNARFDGRWEVPTFDEVVALARRLGVGVIPETKHPSWFASVGLPLEDALVRSLDGFGLPVIVQSFETENLRALRGRFAGESVQLLRGAYDLADIASYCDWVGPPKSVAAGEGFVEAAHAAGLRVMPWTFRREAAFLGEFGDLLAELRAFAALGVDGLFTDNPDLARAAFLSR